MEGHFVIVETGADPLLVDLNLILKDISPLAGFIHQFQILFDVLVKNLGIYGFFICLDYLLNRLLPLLLLLSLYLLKIIRLCHPEFMLKFNYFLGFLNPFITREIRGHLFQVDCTHLFQPIKSSLHPGFLY